MFHWICPECGREIPPAVKECPNCDPLAAAPAPALAAVGAPAIAVVAQVAPPPLPPPPVLHPVDPLALAQKLREVQASYAAVAVSEPETEPEPARLVVAPVPAGAVAAPAPEPVPEPAPEPFSQSVNTVQPVPLHLAALKLATLAPSANLLLATPARVSLLAATELLTISAPAPPPQLPQAPAPQRKPDLVDEPLALAATPAAAEPEQTPEPASEPAPEPIAAAAALQEPQPEPAPQPAPVETAAPEADLGVAVETAPASEAAAEPVAAVATAEPEVKAAPVVTEAVPVAEDAAPVVAEPPDPAAAGRVPTPAPSFTAVAPSPIPLEEPSALSTEPPSTPASPAAPPVSLPEPGVPTLAFGGLQDSSFLGNRIRPAQGQARIARSDPGPRITLPGPALPRALNSLEDAGIARILVEAPRKAKSGGRGWFTGLLVASLLIAAFIGLELYNAPKTVASVSSAPAVQNEVTPVQKEAAPAPAVAPVTSASYPLSKAIEVTGLRLTGSDSKPEVHYLVVNHSPVQLGSVTVYVTVRATPTKPPLYHFSFKAPSLGPNESKEMVASIDKLPQPAPDWRDLHTEVEIGQ